MPKDRRARSSSFDRSRVSPYPCSSKNAELYKSENPLLSVRDEKEWEDARCPICMEHPHNAVFLLCSSQEKGCRPFMCNTSYRHSNCLDQFRKSFAATPSTAPSEGPLSSTAYHRGSEEGVLPRLTRFNGRQQPKLVCPLCRGQINGSVVLEPARRFMNSKSRSCSLETCDFSGTYSELRKHARLEHPSVRPSEADARRQRDWTRLERETEFQDIFSAYQLDYGDERGEDSILRQHEWMALEDEWDIGDILSSVESESDDGRSENSLLLMDFEFELPFSFLEEILPFDPWFGTRESRGPRVTEHSRNRRSARRSRATYHVETSPATGSRGNLSPGHEPGMQ